MYLAEIYIDDFGIYHQLPLKDLQPGLCLLPGKNEAGKSSLLAFIQRVLFGFPDARTKLNLYDPVHGGKKGGRLVLVNGAGERFVVERYDGRKGGVPKVRFPDGNERGPEALHQLVGSLSQEVYRNVFAFSLEELQTLDSLNNDEVREAIYSASIGAGAQKITAVQKALEERRGHLFRPGGQKQQINQTLKALQDTDAAIRQCQQDPEKYAKLQGEILVIQETVHEHEREQGEQRRRLERVKLLAQGWDDWMALQQAREQLASEPELASFPSNGKTHLERLLEQQTEITDRLRDLENQVEQLRSRVEKIQVDENLLNENAEIQALQRGISAFEENVQALPGIQAELKREEQDFQESVRNLDRDWNETKIQSLDASFPVRREAETFEQRIISARDRVKEAETQQAAAERALLEAQNHRRDQKEALQQLPPPADNRPVASIRKLSTGLNQFTTARSDLPALRAELQRAEDEMKVTLAGIGPEWDEKRALQFRDLSAARKALREHQDALTSCQLEDRDAARILEGAGKSLEQASGKVESARTRLEAETPSEFKDEDAIAARQKNLRELKRLLTRRQLHEKDREHTQQRLEDAKDRLDALQRKGQPAGVLALLFVLFSLAVGLACLAGLRLLGQAWLASVTGSVAAAAVSFALLRFLVSRKDGVGGLGEETRPHERIQMLEGELRSFESELETVAGHIRQLADSAGLSDDVDFTLIEDAETRLEQARKTLRDWQAAENELRQSQSEKEDRAGELKDAETSLENAKEKLNARESAWREWLEKQGLDPSLSPDNAADTLNSIQAAREKSVAVRTLRERMEKIKSFISEYAGSVNAILTELGRETANEKDVALAVQELMHWLEQEEEKARAIEKAEQQLADAGKQEQKKNEEAKKARQEHEAAMENLDSIQQEWKEKLNAYGLPQNLSATSARQFIEKLDGCKEKLKNLVRLRERLKTATESADSYCEQVGALAGRIGREPPVKNEVPAFMNRQSEDLETAKKASADRKAFKQKLAECSELTRQEKSALEEKNQEIIALYSAAGADSEEAFRERADRFERQEKLRDAMAESEKNLQRLSGMGENYDRFTKDLASTSLEDLRAEQAALEIELEQGTKEVKERIEELGRNKRELESIERSEQLSALRLRREGLASWIKEAAREWAVLTAAEFLIDKAREKYERDRQPNVIKIAAGYFSRFTEGRYTQVNAPLGEQKIRVADPQQRTLETDKLSRGTAEQLYLALRFGLVQEYSDRTESLPLIFDDILVNFDEDRARAAARAILEFSKQHQILFFTCHPHIVELFRKEEPSVPVFDLGP